MRFGKFTGRIFALLGLLLLPWTVETTAAADGLAENVVVLANRDDFDSVRIARHYATVRGVPVENIFALSMSRDETITWREFVTTIWQPLLERLVASHWIDATSMALTDAVGRRKYAPRGHRITALVVCRGVPLRIAHDAALFTEVLPLTKHGEFRTNAGAVDAELALLAQPNYPINALVSNPLFQNEHPTVYDLGQVVRVGRLDGPTVEDAIGLVDRAVTVERTGLLGRAYVDLANREPSGDRWLESTAAQLSGLGFDLQVDRAPETMPVSARFDAPVLYFGWYASEINGPFTLPNFRFPPGAIALHIHSYSAVSLRPGAKGWTAGFLARGVTATVGNVYEPYLQFTHRPDLLLRALARGATLGEAAIFALPALSWQAILVGDPLYRPFAVSLDEQVRGFDRLPPRWASYATLRRIRQADLAGHPSEAMSIAEAAQQASPSLAIGLELARRRQEIGDRSGAVEALEFAASLKQIDSSEWALIREVALRLLAGGRAVAARDIWRLVLASSSIPREVRTEWLADGAQAATAAGDTKNATNWAEERATLLVAVGKK